MKSYIITPATGGSEYNVEADRYEYDAQSGRHLFYKKAEAEGQPDDLVANLINVSVRS